MAVLESLLLCILVRMVGFLTLLEEEDAFLVALEDILPCFPVLVTEAVELER